MNGFGWRAMIVGAALLIGTSTLAHAQDRDRPAIDAEQLRGKLSEETIDRLTRIAARAQQNGVPPQLIRRKVTEGVSKGVRGARLELAIENYARRLVAARSLLGPRARPEILEAAAQATEHGVPPNRVRDFASANKDPRRAVVGLRVISELHESGVPTDRAVRAVQSALDRGLNGERLLAMSAAVRRRVRQGESPADALREVNATGRGSVRNAPNRDRPRAQPRAQPRDRPRAQPRDQPRSQPRPQPRNQPSRGRRNPD